MLSSVTRWSFLPQATDLHSEFTSHLTKSFLKRRLAQWASQPGVCQHLAVPVSMPLGKQIWGSDGCRNRFDRSLILCLMESCCWRRFLLVTLVGIQFPSPSEPLQLSLPWHLWTLAAKGREGRHTG